MRTASLFVFPAIVLIGLLTLSSSACGDVPPEKRARESFERALRDHNRIDREIRNRLFLQRIQKQFVGVDLKLFRDKYPVPLEAEFQDLTVRELTLKIQELDSILDTLSVTVGERDVKELFLEPPPTSSIPFVGPDEIGVNSVARSVVAIIDRSLMPLANGKWTLTTASLETVTDDNLCDFDPFFGALTTTVEGSGFLVAEDRIVTAAHVIDYPNEDWLLDVYFVFDFVMETEGVMKTVFGPGEVYEGDSVLMDDDDFGADWGVIQLSSPVAGRTPLAYRHHSEPRIPDDASLYMIGHPNGMSQKYIGEAPIHDNSACDQIFVLIDSYPGCSGAPLFNVADNRVEGLLSATVSEVATELCGCYVSAVYSETLGLPGDTVTRTSTFSGFLDNPQTVGIRCEYGVAEVQVDGEWYTLGNDEMIDTPRLAVPFSEFGLTLSWPGADCALFYEPKPGQEWEIVPFEPATIAGVDAAAAGNNLAPAVQMQRVCPEPP